MNHLPLEQRQILAAKLARNLPLSAADYRLIRSLIEEALGMDELHEIEGDGEKCRTRITTSELKRVPKRRKEQANGGQR